MKNLTVFTVYLLVMVDIVSAKEYKVASADECKKAAALVTAGDVIVIANGNYSGWEIILTASGTVAQPIIVRAATPGKVVFSGDVNNAVFLLTGSYTELAGLVFEGCNIIKGGGNAVLMELKTTDHCRITSCIFSKNTVKAQFMPIVVVSGKGNYNRVDHCSFISNIDNQELQVKITAGAIPLYTMIDHNLFKNKDKVSWKNFNGGECVQVGQDPVLLGNQYAYTIVRDNQFTACNGEPEVISNKSSGNKYINNVFENCQGELVMRGGHDCVIDSNRFSGGSGGIRINGTHDTITNNTMMGLPTGIRLMYGMAKGRTAIGFYVAASDCLIKNNRISDGGTGILIGDSKNADWNGKFDTTRYPSPTVQNIAPFNNILIDNIITGMKIIILHNEN